MDDASDLSTRQHIISLYKDAVSCLDKAAAECQKTSSVSIVIMVQNSERCSELISQIKRLDTDPTRLAGLKQLSCTLAHHQEVLHAKLCQLDGRSPSSDTGSSDGSQPQETTNGNKSRRLAIQDTIVPKGRVTMDDVAGLQDAKQALKEAIVMPVYFPHLFTGNRKPWKRILLYGPPGTGKSRLAQAISSAINSTFYCVSSSDLISSWVGESEKLIKELFQHAKTQDGRSVVFIDEIDSICRRRTSREEEHTRRVKNELLKQMEGADGDAQSDTIFLLCATNCPWELDSAFLRRFQKRIYIPLPDREARLALLHIHSRESMVELSDADWDQLVDKTEGFSGSDIATVVLAALYEPIRDMQTAHYWTYTPDGKLVPCDGSQPGRMEAMLTDLPPEKVQSGPVTMKCFIKSLAVNRQTVNPAELQRFTEFTSTFGQNG